MKKAIIFLLSFYSCAGFAESQQARSDYSTEESQAKNPSYHFFVQEGPQL